MHIERHHRVWGLMNLGNFQGLIENNGVTARIQLTIESEDGGEIVGAICPEGTKVAGVLIPHKTSAAPDELLLPCVRPLTAKK